MATLLEIKDLTVQYAAMRQSVPALNGITFNVYEGEVVGFLGESGSGKTTLGLAILGLLPHGGRIVRGSIRFRGKNLLGLGEKELEQIRGAGISMIFQEPELALNPVIRALDQVEEVIHAHRCWSRGRCREEAQRVLAEVQLDKDPRLFSAYPHQLSGGERQRLVIAQALACRPALLIADEPSASLDSITQNKWLELMKDLRYRLGIAVLLITHNPAIFAGFADRVIVIYGGRIVEEARFDQIIRQPQHPYTKALLDSTPPAPGSGAVKKRLPMIAAARALRQSENTGCPFEARCPDRLPVCSHKEPPETLINDQRRVRCFKYGG